MEITDQMEGCETDGAKVELTSYRPKPGPQQQQCRSNWQLCRLLLRDCCWGERGFTPLLHKFN